MTTTTDAAAADDDDHGEARITTTTNDAGDGDGSGLALYFRDFLPIENSSDDDKNSDNRTDGNNFDYSTSLSKISVTSKVATLFDQNLGVTYHHTTTDNYDYDDDDNSKINDTTAAAAAEIIHSTSSPDMMTFQQWRSVQKQALMKYLHRRYFPRSSMETTTTMANPEEENDDNEYESVTDVSNEEEYDDDEQEDHDEFMDVPPVEASQDDDDDYFDDPMVPETQPQTQPQLLQKEQLDSLLSPADVVQKQKQQVEGEEEEGETGATMGLMPSPKEQQKLQQQQPRKRKRRKIVPHVMDTLHDVAKLEYLDLYTQTLHLPLCKVNKIWRLRDTKRHCGNQISYTRVSKIAKPVPQILHGPIPRYPYECVEEDGPISTTFKQVLSMEVEQIKLVDTNKGSTTVGGGPLGGTGRRRRQRIKIFFYNAYATEISEWLEKQQRQQKKKKQKREKREGSSRNQQSKIHDDGDDESYLVMSFSNIPAGCIFPFAIDRRNWLDRQDMVEYCLCIGDQSGVRLMIDGQYINSRFDTDDLEIRLAEKEDLDDIDDGLENVDDGDNNGSSAENVELTLSRRSFNAYFLSGSSEKPSPVEGGDVENEPNNNLHRISPLLQSWQLYKAQIKSENEARSRKRFMNPPQHSTIQSSSHQPPRENQEDNDRHQATTMIQPNCRQGQTSGPSHGQDDQAQPQQQQQTIQPQEIEPMTFEGDATRNAASAHVDYIKLGDLRSIIDENKKAGRGHATVNLRAAVLGFTCPSLTRRGDWMATAALIDDSCTTPVTIIMFCTKPSQLPKLAWMGDILCIHRVGLELWKGDIQLNGWKSSSYVVVRRTQSSGWRCIPTASKYFTFHRSDEERTQLLWHWAQSYVSENSTIKMEHCFTLATMSHMSDEEEEILKDRDITVMIAGKYLYPELPSGITPCGFLRIWDGTGLPPSDPMVVQTLFTQQARGRGDPPPEALARVAAIVRKMQDTNPTMEIPKALCGRVSNVLVWEESHWTLIKEHVPVGTFVRLRNVDIRRWQNNQFRSLMVHSKTWLTPLPDQNFEVHLLLQAHNGRLLRNEYNPESGLLPSTCFLGNSLIMFTNQEGTGEYTGNIRLVKPVPEMQGDQLKKKLLAKENDPDFPLALLIADRSGSIAVLPTEEVRTTLLRMMLSTDQNTVHPRHDNYVRILFASRRHFKVTIHSIQWDDERYFVLKNLSELD